MQPAEVCGTWTPIDGQSVLPPAIEALRDRAPPTRLDLRPDGTFDAATVPLADGSGFASAGGTWRLAQSDREYDVVRIVVLEPAPPGPALAAPRVMGPILRRSPPQRLAFVLGEPGDGTGVMLGR